MERMKRKRLLAGVFGACVALAALSLGGVEASSVGDGGKNAAQGRADVVVIDGLKQFGPLDEPAVAFLHDQHTEALAKQKGMAEKGCNLCHLQKKDGSQDGRMSIKYMRLDDVSKNETRDVYHANCIKCHADMTAAGQKSGPTDVNCRGCHAAKAPEAARQPVVVDAGLHFRHAKTHEKDAQKCGACHHQWDAQAKKITPAAKEADVPGACVYCHKDKAVKEPGQDVVVRSLRDAAHGECVLCHKAVLAPGVKPEDSGPVTCAGCHSAEAQAKIKERTAQAVTKAGGAIRMDRKQPDVVLLSTEPKVLPAPAAPATPAAGRMSAVPFNHKLHEEKNATCSACHHASLASCSKECHQLTGAASKKGGGVNIAQAMHSAKSLSSCVGCHAKEQAKPECAGCHGFMKKGLNENNPASCDACHMKAEAGETPQPGASAEEKTAVAAKLLQVRKPVVGTYPVDDIPEKVVIGAIADQYQPSELPHRKIVLSMVEAVKNSSLAGNFHQDEGAVCRGCHHNSPASKKPPRCASCHGAGFDADKPNMPELKTAYHRQCMGCHTMMGIDGKVYAPGVPGAKPVPVATDCEGCHKKKNS